VNALGASANGLRELGLFAGAGGGLLASRLLGWRTVCAVEIDAHCQRVLAQRQRDGHLEPFPIWDDIRTFDGRPWSGAVDVVSGGFPCQDISSAGRGAGLSGDRSGLWFEMLRVIGEARPAYVFAENSPWLRTRGLDVVLSGLAGLGFDAAWGVLGAHHVGAPHKRDRMWIVASHPDRCRERGLPFHAEMAGAPSATGDAANTADARSSPRRASELPLTPGRSSLERSGAPARADWWSVHRFAGVDDGVASRVERVRATGNGQVPRVAELAWLTLRP
jgi:DNA (cytosine-5)-methyltransferase 1